MPKRKQDPLFRLIKSLSPAEKRHFRLYANRTMSDRQRKFLVLFDLLDKQDTYDPEQLLKKLPGKTTNGKLSNLKRHLFSQLLTSLRLTHINKLIDIEIREQLDFARILYSKGLYMESLRLLERNREIAEEHNQEILHLQILEFQKLIESRHITRSRQVEKKMERLLEASTRHGRTAQAHSEMVNLYIQIHGHYIVYGFATRPEEVKRLRIAWENMQPQLPGDRFENSFFERIYLYHSNLWYRYIQLDLPEAIGHAREAVTLFDLNHPMKYKDPDLYLRSLYYLSVLLYLSDDEKEHAATLRKTSVYLAEMDEQLNLNSRHVRFVYFNLSRFNECFLRGDYTLALALAREVYDRLDTHRALMDDHRVLLFQYKFAAAAFGAGAYEEALAYLHPILHQDTLPLQKEMEINARLLELLALYASEQFDRLGYRLNAFRRGVLKKETLTTLQLATYQLLQYLLKHYPAPADVYLREQLHYFRAQADLPRERLFLKYLNVLEWLETVAAGGRS